MTTERHVRWIYLAVCCVLVAVGLFSCRRIEPVPPLGQHQLSYSRIVDLSQVVTQDMPTHPGTLPPALHGPSLDGTADRMSLSARNGSHLSTMGTGRDSSVEHLSAQDLIAPAVVIDLRDMVQDRAAYRIDAAAIAQWERDHGTIAPSSMVLLATGWDVHWSTPGAYMNLDTDQRIHAPSVDESALALLGAREVRGVGIDAPQIVAPPLALPAATDWIVLEDLTNLEQLPPQGTTLVIGALKLQGSSASPARVFAFVP